MDHRNRRPDPRVGLSLVSSFTERVSAALMIVAAIDAALIVLLLEGLRTAPEAHPILQSIIPTVLLGASLVRAGRGLVPRRHRDEEPARGAGDASARLRSSSQRFIHKWNAVKVAGGLMVCALAWRFVAIRLT
jgi:hypothetical protein